MLFVSVEFNTILKITIMMPRIKGRPKKQINYKIPHDLEIMVCEAIQANEFSSQGDLLTAALREYFNEKNINKYIRAYLESQEGRELIKKIIEEKD